MKIGITYDTAEMYTKNETNDLHFDFAFSFAGEDRSIVKSIASNLSQKGYNVFYDNNYSHLLVGKDLYRYLRNLYSNKCRFVVCFISGNYKRKVWTNLEMTAVKERLMETFFADDFLIPIILDNAEMIEDIPSFFGFYKHNSIDETTELLVNKINSKLNEDILINGVDNFINYLCEQLYQQLKNKFIYVSKYNNKITIQQEGKENWFVFESDKKAFTKSILIRKNQAPNNDFVLPDYIIHWNKQNGLGFTVYDLNVEAKKIKEEKTFNELIKYLSELILNN